MMEGWNDRHSLNPTHIKFIYYPVVMHIKLMVVQVFTKYLVRLFIIYFNCYTTPIFSCHHHHP